MSRDIYDQFRAAQEALAAQARQAAEENNRRLSEATQRAAEIEAARNAEIARAAAEKIRVREAKITAQREALQPATQQLQDILEAIKTHDPRIQAARLKEVVTDSQILGTEDDPKLLVLLLLRWGNKFGLTPQEDYQLEHPKKGLIAKYLGEEAPDLIVAEDFQQITVALDADRINFISEHYPYPTLKTDTFISDNSLVFPSLVTAVEHPLSRYLGYSLATHRSSREHYYLPTDRQGRVWDVSSSDLYGNRQFHDEPGEPMDP